MTDSTEQTPSSSPAVPPELAGSELEQAPSFSAMQDEFLAHYWSFVGESSPSETMWRSPSKFSGELQVQESLPIEPQLLPSEWLAFLFSRSMSRLGVLIIVGVFVTQIVCNLSVKGIDRSTKP